MGQQEVFEQGSETLEKLTGQDVSANDWKEMKLTRIFTDKSLLPENKKRNFIRESTYIAHLGGKHPFLDKVEKVIGSKDSMVWVADGAKCLPAAGRDMELG